MIWVALIYGVAGLSLCVLLGRCIYFGASGDAGPSAQSVRAHSRKPAERLLLSPCSWQKRLANELGTFLPRAQQDRLRLAGFPHFQGHRFSTENLEPHERASARVCTAPHTRLPMSSTRRHATEAQPPGGGV